MSSSAPRRTAQPSTDMQVLTRGCLLSVAIVGVALIAALAKDPVLRWNAALIQRLWPEGLSSAQGEGVTLPLSYVALLLVSVVLPFPLAWFGGRLARGGWNGERLAGRGWIMLISLWGAVVLLAWAGVVLAVVLVSPRLTDFARWALASLVLSPFIPIGLILVNLISGAVSVWAGPGRNGVEAPGLAAGRRTYELGDPYTGLGSSGDGGDGDAGKALLLLIIAVVAGTFAILTVWLIARASARRAGVNLSFGSAYLGRPPSSPRARGHVVVAS